MIIWRFRNLITNICEIAYLNSGRVITFRQALLLLQFRAIDFCYTYKSVIENTYCMISVMVAGKTSTNSPWFIFNNFTIHIKPMQSVYYFFLLKLTTLHLLYLSRATLLGFFSASAQEHCKIGCLSSNHQWPLWNSNPELCGKYRVLIY